MEITSRNNFEKGELDGSKKIRGWLATSGHASLITSLTTFHGTDGSPSLDRPARIPKKALCEFARALADSSALFAVSVHNANHLHLLLRCLVVAGLIGAFCKLLVAAVPLCVESNP